MTGEHTFERDLPALDRRVREAIVLTGDLPDGSEVHLTLAYEYRIGGETR